MALFMNRMEFVADSKDPWDKDVIATLCSMDFGRPVRLYSSYFGNTDRVILEWDFDSLEDYQNTLNKLGDDKEFLAKWDKLNQLTVAGGGRSELWWRRNG